MIFYLKVNRLIDYTIRNLQAWVRIIGLMDDSYAYILCDNEKLADRIQNEIDFKGVQWSFLESCRDEKYSELVDAISVTEWHNAAYAHLTPFIHAKEKGYKECWNIDADDTLLCVSPERAKQILETVSAYAVDHNKDLFSLDMWRSRSIAKHWSFGITYVNCRVDWLDIMRRHVTCEKASIHFTNGNHAKNIDEYFTYIRATDMDVSIETFCINNLLFVHYSDDFIMNPIISGVFKWKGDKLEFPIIKHIYNIDSLGEINIAEDIIKFDIGLEEFEGGWALAQIAPFRADIPNIIEAAEYEKLRENLVYEQIKKNIESFISEIRRSIEVYIFGCGKYTELLIDILRSYGIEITAILDNGEFKWGITVNGVSVCDPEIIKEVKNKDISILIDVRHHVAIKKQLMDYKIPEEHVFMAIDFMNMQ